MLTRRFVVALIAAVLLVPVLGAQDTRFRTASTAWDSGSLGNHRAVVRVGGTARGARAVIPWRRRDPDPGARLVIVTDAAGQRIANVRRGRIDREAGEIWFEPTAGPGRYFVYYFPFVMGGRRNYPTVTYPAAEQTADPNWLAILDTPGGTTEAIVEAFEAIDDFNRFDPMEVIATYDEVVALLRSRPGARYLVFPEDRLHPIRLRTDLPQRWALAGVAETFSGEAARGEYFAFQLGIYAVEAVNGVRVSFSDLSSPQGRRIDASLLGCINTQGVDWNGTPIAKQVDVPKGTVQPVWCGVDVPQGAAPGEYSGEAVVSAGNAASTRVRLAVTVLDHVVADGGAGEPWKQTRLKWLNSTLGQRNDVIAPYTPLQVDGSSVSLLGRRVTLAPSGLPAKVQTFFTQEMTSLSAVPTDVIASPIELAVETGGRQRVVWQTTTPAITEQTPGTVRWIATSRSPSLELKVTGAMEFDGFVAYTAALTALKDTEIDDVRLVLPYTRGAASYIMGLGLKGGRRPARLDWKWDVATKNQDGAWIGGVNAGLSFSLRGDNYVRPLNTNFYLQKPLNLPPSWGNAGAGGITIDETDPVVRVSAYSGRRTMKAGDTQRFDFNLVITPFHPIDTDFQWRTRFYHRHAPVDTVAATGATVVNVHHATSINPWINYPFIAHREMKAYVDEAHRKGLKVKIYNTVRELSNRAHELFALRSLGHEIFTPGPGGGFAWLQEHLGDDYIAAWFVPELQDAAIINSGMSRWHNYYVEGMNWLVQNVGIDGIYLDDVAFDRTTMKRIKRVLTADGHPGIVDLHSANQFNERDGFVNSAVLYLEHFPYLNRLWFGEYFDYEKNPPEFFLTEVSGIPFGLMGEMLEGGGNPWRGMVFGMTNRMPWTENSDPRPIWKAWDDFGMQGTRMIGYWVDRAPVKTDRPDVLATTYAKAGRALLAVGSWAEADTEIRLRIDWDALGIDPARAVIAAPAIQSVQGARRFKPGDLIPVPKGKGWLLVLSEER